MIVLKQLSQVALWTMGAWRFCMCRLSKDALLPVSQTVSSPSEDKWWSDPQKGAGTSSLLSMLPAPKKEGVSLLKCARVLGGGLKGPDILGTMIFMETNHELPVAHLSSTTARS